MKEKRKKTKKAAAESRIAASESIFKDADGARKENEFFSDLRARVSLPAPEKRAMLADFKNALSYLAGTGTEPDEALRRLDISNLGGFYSRPSRIWYPLDNAAKIYPVSMKRDYMSVFRLSVYLREDVVPQLLQTALTFTVKRFPSFATTVKKGFFWHYLESTKRRFTVTEETGTPCRPIRIGQSGSQTFRVLYYKNRISVEFFHILTDGAGGMAFLKTLTAEYFRLLGVECGDAELSANAIVDTGELANEFDNARTRSGASGFAGRAAVQYGGRLSRVRPCQVIHFKMDAELLRNTASARGATVTAYILSLMFAASRRACDDIKGDFNIQVPINMRKFYPSKTVRNFSMYCGVRIPLEDITEPDALIPEITRQLAEKTSPEAAGKMVNATNRLTDTLRFVPLFLKAPVAKLVYGFLGDKIFTNTLSNLGVVTLPDELAARTAGMDFVLGTVITNRASCAMVTFGDTTTLSVSKNTADPSFETALYGYLCDDGITPSVEGSELIED